MNKLICGIRVWVAYGIHAFDFHGFGSFGAGLAGNKARTGDKPSAGRFIR